MLCKFAICYSRRVISLFSKVKLFVPYIILILFLILLSFGTRLLFKDASHFTKEVDFQLFIGGAIIFVGYYINRIAPKTIIPSFVWAIFAGMAIQPLVSPYLKDISGLKIIMEVFAAIILFAGGLEIPFKNFKRWFFPILSLSFVGVILSSLIFALILYLVAGIFGNFEQGLLPSILILSAALASTDPTAIIPMLKQLHFKRSLLSQIAISESALTDVSGSILTRFLLVALVSIPISSNANIIELISPLLQKATYDALALQIISGIVVGYLGYWLIKRFYYREGQDQTKEADPALLISIPIFTFVLGNFLGGAGFLAAFVSGLLSDVKGDLRSTSRFYEDLLNHLIKPFIFIILGALVPVATLIKLAPLGILSGLLFMFVVRPLVVFTSLMPWVFKMVFRLEDIIFLSFVRETGIIAAVLIIIAATFKIISSEFVIAIGMWVILLTLIIEPPLTPFLAKKIGVAK